MSSVSDARARVRFGSFEADLRSGELFEDARRVPLPNQSFLALAALLERPGQLVSREELRAKLWPDRRVVEFEQGLNAIINRLREALGDSAAHAKYIETLPRRGYRFVAAVESCASMPPSHPVATVDVGGATSPADAAATKTSTQLETGPTSRRSAKIYWAAAALVGMLTWAAFARFEDAPPTDTLSFSSIRVQPSTSSMGREAAPTFSPDGAKLAYAWNGGNPSDAPDDRRFALYVRSTDSERTLPLTRADALSIAASWSRDGRQLAVARITDRESGIYRVFATGGGETLLARANFLIEDYMQSSWSPDDQFIAYSAMDAGGQHAIQLLTSNGLEARALERPSSCVDAALPAFSPDGHQLAYLCISSHAVYDVHVLELPSGAPRTLASLQGYPKGLAWMSNGRALLLANDAADGSALWHVSSSGALSRVPGTEEALGPGLALAGDRIAFVREKRSLDIWRLDLTQPTAAGRALIASTRKDLVPQYSPDGAHIAFQSTRSGSSEIWVAQADGEAPVKVTTFDGPLTGAPSWCSDGRRVAFDSRGSGVSAIYVVDILEGRPHRLETSVVHLAMPTWSADCQWIFASDGRAKLYRLPAAGGSAVLFTERPSYRAVVSGPNVIFNVAGADGVELWSKPAAGGTESALPDMPRLSYSDSWAAAPRGIYFVSRAPATSGSGGEEARPSQVIAFYEFASRRTRVVRGLSGPPAPLGGLGMTVDRDEHWLLYTRSAAWESDVMLMSGMKW